MRTIAISSAVLAVVAVSSVPPLAFAGDAAKPTSTPAAGKAGDATAPSELPTDQKSQMHPSTSAVKNPNDPDMKAGDDRAREKNKVQGEDAKLNLETGERK